MRFQKAAMRCSTFVLGAGVAVGAARARPPRSKPPCMPAVDARKSATVVRARGLRPMRFSAHWPRSEAETQSPGCIASMRAQNSAMRCSTLVVGAGAVVGAVGAQAFAGGFERKRYPVSVLYGFTTRKLASRTSKCRWNPPHDPPNVLPELLER